MLMNLGIKTVTIGTRTREQMRIPARGISWSIILMTEYAIQITAIIIRPAI
jgi:hypothetical protein